MRTPAILLALLSILLAGCSGGGGAGGGGDGDSSGTPTAAPPGTPSGDGVPSWTLGDWWTYDTPFGESTYVVTADQGSDWFLDTTNPETAFLDARTDVSRLGPQRKSDLAGSQGAERVEFFRWPLSDGASWMTTWDGEDVTVTASAGPDGSFDFLAENATAPMYRYTYLPATGWFGELRHLGADGQPDSDPAADFHTERHPAADFHPLARAERTADRRWAAQP